MLKRLALIAATGALAAACASSAPPTGPAAPAANSATPAAPAAPSVILNVAASSSWTSEERLLPQDPILALVGASGSLNEQVGFSMTCNPDNGKITARLGKQAANRAGQSAMYRIRAGAEARQVEGKFEKQAQGPDADFVFGLTSAELRAMAASNTFSVITDTGEVQWAFVNDPATQVQAKYVGSTKGLPQESAGFLVFCNPK